MHNYYKLCDVSMDLKLFKKVMVIAFVTVIAVNLFACGKKDSASTNETTTTFANNTDDFDGNLMEIVNIDEGEFSKTLSKPFKKETYSKKDETNMSDAKKMLESIDFENDNKFIECVYGDLESELSVWSLIKNRNGKTLNNYGVLIRYNEKNYLFEDVCHGNNPTVDYDDEKGIILLSGGVMEGTGTLTEGLYIFKVGKDKVEKIGFVDPYDVQNYFADNIKFDVNNNIITFKLGNKVISQFTNTEDGQGTLKAIAIGDQIAYEIGDDHSVKVNVTPGLQFVTVVTMDQVKKDMSAGKVVLVASGSSTIPIVIDDSNDSTDENQKITMNNPAGSNIGTFSVLSYENTPTFTADVAINGADANFSNIRVSK